MATSACGANPVLHSPGNKISATPGVANAGGNPLRGTGTKAGRTFAASRVSPAKFPTPPVKTLVAQGARLSGTPGSTDHLAPAPHPAAAIAAVLRDLELQNHWPCIRPLTHGAMVVHRNINLQTGFTPKIQNPGVVVPQLLTMMWASWLTET